MVIKQVPTVSAKIQCTHLLHCQKKINLKSKKMGMTGYIYIHILI